MDLVIRIKLNWVTVMPWFSHFLGNRTINFRMFECLVTCFLKVMVLLLYWLQAISKIHVPIYPCLIISEGRRNVQLFDRHSNETVTVTRHVAKYKHMQKNWGWYFLENLRIVALKLLKLTQYVSPNLSIYCNFVRCWGSVMMLTFLN